MIELDEHGIWNIVALSNLMSCGQFPLTRVPLNLKNWPPLVPKSSHQDKCHSNSNNTNTTTNILTPPPPWPLPPPPPPPPPSPQPQIQHLCSEMWSHVFTLTAHSLSSLPFSFSLNLALCITSFWHSHLWSVILVYLILVVSSMFSLNSFNSLMLRNLCHCLKFSQELLSENSLKMQNCPKTVQFPDSSQNVLIFSAFLSECLDVSIFSFSQFSQFLLFVSISSTSFIVSKIHQIFSSFLIENFGSAKQGLSAFHWENVFSIFLTFFLTFSHFSHIFSIFLISLTVPHFSFSIILIFLVLLIFLRISLFLIESSHLLNINLSFARVFNFLKSKSIATNFSMVAKDLVNDNVWHNGRLLSWGLQLPHCKGPNHEITLSFSFEKRKTKEGKRERERERGICAYMNIFTDR